MSDMGSSRITVRIPERLTTRLRNHSRIRQTSESSLVREALEKYLQRPTPERSAYDWAREAGILGSIDASSDLSTNPRYFKGFGRKK